MSHLGAVRREAFEHLDLKAIGVERPVNEHMLHSGTALGVERAAHALGLSRLDSTTDLPSQAADAFLWAVAQDLPPDLKEILARELPTELKARMNLGTMHSEEAKVA